MWVVVQLIYMVARSSEFSSIVVREEEQPELETLMRKTCPLHVRGGAEDKHGKISILIQASAATPCPPHLGSCRLGRASGGGRLLSEQIAEVAYHTCC